MLQAQPRSTIRRASSLAVLVGAVASACTGSIGGSSNGNGNSGPSGVGSGGATGTSGGSGTGSGTGGGGPNGACTPTTPVAQRMVRLSFAQVASTISALLGPNALKDISVDNPRQRAFQALFVEGDLVNTQVLSKTVQWGDSAIATLTDPAVFTQLTGCASPVTDACASAFLTSFAEKAYRRPLSADETTSLMNLYSVLKAGGSTIDEATRYVIEGAIVSPQALYRTEYGKAGGLSDFEMASELSYFLTNGPPDAALLTAAKNGKVSVPDDVRVQVDRLLGGDATLQNLNQVMMAYYLVGQIDSVVKDPAVFPDFTIGMRNSMYTGTQKFIENNLWKGKAGEILTVRTSYVDENLAKLYGVTYPAAPGSGFVPFTFSPGQRAGILTEASILSVRARTDNTSVVSRGLYINSNVLCNQTPPPPPPSVADQVNAQKADLTATERQKSDYRRMTAPCNTCHTFFDPYGLVLETYDGIGRFRSSYPNGTAIDTSVTLPDFAGGGSAADVTAFVTQEAGNGVFSRCLTTNMMKYALAEGPVDANDCSVKEVHDGFLATDQSFASLLRQIALSKTLSVRGTGP